MRRTKAVAEREDYERTLLKQLYELFPVNEPQEGVSVGQLTALLGSTVSKVGHAKRSFEGAGILRTTLQYTGNQGRVATWMLRVPYEEAVTLLERHQQQDHPKTALAKHDSEKVRAITGNDPESPFAALRWLVRNDDAEALVEAARQYAARQRVVEEHLGAIEAAGIHVDRDRLSELIVFQPDERLGAVAEVLPILDRYAEAIERLQSAIVEVRPLRKKIEILELENRRQKEQIERLIAKNGAATQP